MGCLVSCRFRSDRFALADRSQRPISVNLRELERAAIKLEHHTLFQSLDLFVKPVVVPVANGYEVALIRDKCANLHRIRVVGDSSNGILFFPTISISALESGKCVRSQPARTVLTAPPFKAQDFGCQEVSASANPLANTSVAIATTFLMGSTPLSGFCIPCCSVPLPGFLIERSDSAPCLPCRGEHYHLGAVGPRASSGCSIAGTSIGCSIKNSSLSYHRANPASHSSDIRQ